MSRITATGVAIRGLGCFRDSWVDLGTVKPVNLIVGRNNAGKSRVLDAVELLCSHSGDESTLERRFEGRLDEAVLRQFFPQNTSGGTLKGNYWTDHGQHLIGRTVSWVLDRSDVFRNIEFVGDRPPASGFGPESDAERLSVLRGVVERPSHRYSGLQSFRIRAERDIQPEAPDANLTIMADGRGATNVIRKHLVTSDSTFPRARIQRDVLGGLNEIFGQDGEFTELVVRLHDRPTGAELDGKWEVYLAEPSKDLVPLSKSGSGLKTVLLVLLGLLVVPKLRNVDPGKIVWAFEELENNLHPTLLRRLLSYLERWATNNAATLFVTTHASVALDVFGSSPNAQILHVRHDGAQASVSVVGAHFDRIGVVAELGARPSDLLQANGIVWVEGPSDWVYLTRWIDLLSQGRLREGRDYQCAFYGGSLLARAQFVSPEAAEQELVNLLRVNNNIIVVCDGDRATPKARVKDRVRRIRAEVRRIPGAHIWVTAAREIENYLTGDVLERALHRGNLPDPMQHEAFLPRRRDPGNSYSERHALAASLDKVELATLAVPHMTLTAMRTRFDWEAQVQVVVDHIDRWNAS